jgi:ACT domain-containing protein
MENNPTVDERTEKDKLALLETLKEMPIIQVACKKVGINKSTYYRWRKEDGDFLKQSEDALKQGFEFINDMSESQIVQLIREKKMPAISMWLKNHHPIYGAKIANFSSYSKESTLSTKDKKLIKQAMKLMR